MGGLKIDEVSHLKKKERELLIGVCINDFSLLHDLLEMFRMRMVHNVVLDESERWDSTMDVLIIQEGLSPPLFTLKEPPFSSVSKDPEITFDRAVSLALGREHPKELLIGIDPGKRPGIAFISDGILVAAKRAISVREVVVKVRKGIKAYGPKSSLIRIGDGDPISRDPLIDPLRSLGCPMEIVDETMTTKTKKHRDENAAVLIASTKGEPL